MHHTADKTERIFVVRREYRVIKNGVNDIECDYGDCNGSPAEL